MDIAVAYTRAAVGDATYCLGVRLLPFSLGHWLHLAHQENTFAVGGIPTEADLIAGAFICSQPWEQLAVTLRSPWLPWYLRLWGWRARRLDKAKELLIFRDYIKAGSYAPEVNRNANAAAAVCPWEAHFKTNFMALGYTHTEAMNLPIAMLNVEHAASGERAGTMNLTSNADRQAAEMAREMARTLASQPQGGGGVSILKMVAQLTLDGSRFKGELKKSESEANKFASHLGSGIKAQIASAFGVGAAVAGMKQLLDYAGKINDLSEAGMGTTDDLQKLDYAMTLVGGSVEDVVRGMNQLAKARREALKNPDSEQSDVFKKLGFDADRLKPLKDGPELFYQLSEALKGVEIDLESLPELMVLFGKSAQSVIPALKGGLREAGDEIERMGGLIEKQTLKNFDRFGDGATKMGRQTVGILAVMGGQLLELAETARDKYMELIQLPAEAMISMYTPGTSAKEQQEALQNLEVAIGNVEYNRGARRGEYFTFEDKPIIKKPRHSPDDPKKVEELERRLKLKQDALAFGLMNDAAKLSELDRQKRLLEEGAPNRAGAIQFFEAEEKLLDIAERRLAVEESIAKARASLQEQFDREQFRSLSKDDKKKDLAAKIKQMEDRLSGKFSIQDLSETETLKARTELLKAKADLESLGEDTATPHARKSLDSDSLQQQGILTGGTLGRAAFYQGTALGGGAASDIPKQQLTEAQKQTVHLKKIAEQSGVLY